MKRLCLLTVFVVSASNTWSQPKPATCVILKRASAGARFLNGTEFQYVEGTYPPGFSFRANLGARRTSSIVKKGGAFVVVEPNYTTADLEAARQRCAEQLK